LNDLNTLVRRAKEFLGDGDKVRVVCRFRAREVTHPEIGLKQMQKIAEMLAEISTVEKAASLDGKQMVMVLLPKPGAQGKKKNAEDQNKQDGGEEV
jgi:translation initiation factor IF-3